MELEMLNESIWTVATGYTRSDTVANIVASNLGDRLDKHLERLMHLQHKVKMNDIDTTCMDICNIGVYLETVLEEYFIDQQWSKYKQWYDGGIEMMDLLRLMHAKRPEMNLDCAIIALDNVYHSDYYPNIAMKH